MDFLNPERLRYENLVNSWLSGRSATSESFGVVSLSAPTNPPANTPKRTITKNHLVLCMTGKTLSARILSARER